MSPIASITIVAILAGIFSLSDSVKLSELIKSPMLKLDIRSSPLSSLKVLEM